MSSVGSAKISISLGSEGIGGVVRGTVASVDGSEAVQSTRARKSELRELRCGGLKGPTVWRGHSFRLALY